MYVRLPVGFLCVTCAEGFVTPLLQPRRSGSKASSSLSNTASKSEIATATDSLSFRIAVNAIESLFAIDPVFQFFTEKARDKIIGRSNLLGVNWQASVDGMRMNMDVLQGNYDTVLDKSVWNSTPEYYKSPFHAYKEGNLCWQAALEVEPSAISVHATLFTENGELELEGDDKLRQNFHDRALEMLQENNLPPPKDVLDLGCSTGLSTLALARTFNSARVAGADLSPHMLAVARFVAKRPQNTDVIDRVAYVHAAAENTGFSSGSFDLVSLCLVAHELPKHAMTSILQEARRVLRPGGAFMFMDMDPNSAAFARMSRNPMAFAGFKSTEPFLVDYVQLDLEKEMAAAGFERIQMRNNSARHRTVVAFA